MDPRKGTRRDKKVITETHSNSSPSDSPILLGQHLLTQSLDDIAKYNPRASSARRRNRSLSVQYFKPDSNSVSSKAPTREFGETQQQKENKTHIAKSKPNALQLFSRSRSTSSTRAPSHVQPEMPLLRNEADNPSNSLTRSAPVPGASLTESADFLVTSATLQRSKSDSMFFPSALSPSDNEEWDSLSASDNEESGSPAPAPSDNEELEFGRIITVSKPPSGLR